MNILFLLVVIAYSNSPYLDKMGAILDLAAILDLRKWAKVRFYLSRCILKNIRIENHLENEIIEKKLMAYGILDTMGAILDLVANGLENEKAG